MAQRTNVVYVSDLSDKPITDNDAPTVTFGYDGNDYEIDLTTQEAEKFHNLIAPYISNGRKVSKSSKRGGKKAVQNGATAADIRAWAEQNGMPVPARGRIPAEVREAYDAAN